MYDQDAVLELKRELLNTMLGLLELSPTAWSDVAQTWEMAKHLHLDAAEVQRERSHLALVKG